MDRGPARARTGRIGDAAGCSRRPKAFAALLAVSALGVFALALRESLVPAAATATIPCALALHGALPLADALLGTLLGLASLALRRGSPGALLFALPAGAMLWCRAAQDALFHLAHAPSSAALGTGLLFETAVDVIGFALGGATLAWLWHWRIAFAASEHSRDADTARPAALSALGVVLLLTAAGITAAWVGWFTAGRAALASQRCVVAFADSFLLAEGGVVLAAVLGGIGILRGQSRGLLWSLATSGGLAFVASVEALFFAQHWRPDTPEAGLGPVVILLLTATSGISAGAAWRCRGWLLANREAIR